MTHRRTTSRAAARFSQRSEVVLLQTRHAQARDSRLDVAIIAGVPRDLVNDDARRAYDRYDMNSRNCGTKGDIGFTSAALPPAGVIVRVHCSDDAHHDTTPRIVRAATRDYGQRATNRHAMRSPGSRCEWQDAQRR